MVLRITYFKDIKFVLRCVSAGSSVSATGVYGPPGLHLRVDHEAICVNFCVNSVDASL